jgi:hypothetical protein
MTHSQRSKHNSHTCQSFKSNYIYPIQYIFETLLSPAQVILYKTSVVEVTLNLTGKQPLDTKVYLEYTYGNCVKKKSRKCVRFFYVCEQSQQF